MNLVYVNELGPNFRGDNIYEFIFSDIDDVWGDDWDAEPANGRPQPPNIDYVKKVGVLKNSEIELTLIQNSDFFGVYDAVDGVIALAWEKGDSDEILISKKKRLVFQYGETVESVENKLYERDIVLKWEKNLVSDEKYEL
ncbi:MAG: hypothetical protein RLZZ479_1403 [Bacteroidota bacterium]|jgi:hypothetical protein